MKTKKMKTVLWALLTLSSFNIYAVGNEDQYKNDCTPMSFFSFSRFAHKINSYDWRLSFHKAEGKLSSVNDGKVVNHSFTKKADGSIVERREEGKQYKKGLLTTTHLQQKDSKLNFNDEGNFVGTDDKQALVNETKVAPDYKVRMGSVAFSSEGQIKTTINTEGDVVYQPKMGIKMTPSIKLPVSYEVVVGAEGEYSKGKEEKDGLFVSPAVKFSLGNNEFKANTTITGMFVPRTAEDVQRLKERDQRRHEAMEKYSTLFSFE